MLNIASPFIPILFLRLILNEITVGRDMRRLILYVLLLAAASFIKDLFGSMLDYRVKSHTEIAVRKIKNRLGELVTEMPYADAEQPGVRDLIARAEDGTNFTQVFDRISEIVTSFITILGLTALILAVQPVIFLFVALVVVLRLFADKKNRRLWEERRPEIIRTLRKGNYNLNVMQSIEFGKEIRINNLQDWLYDRTDRLTDDYLHLTKRYNRDMQRNNILPTVISVFQEGAVYLILAYKVVFEGMPIGDFYMYMTSVSTFSESVTAIVGSLSSLMETGLFIRDFRYCIEIAGKSKTGGEKPIEGFNEKDFLLELDNVSFKYPNTERFILKNVSLTLKKGESLSIVGANGAGKTTLIKLICRLYEPTEGRILLNGTDIRTYSYGDYADLIGAVFQDFKLFGFSVRENVALGTASDEKRVRDALERIGLAKKVDGLPKGLDTNISKEFDSQGIEFSGGEGQKLAMARALYKNAPVMILDEPTSALDPIAEAEIYQKFHEMTEKHTAVYISHRLSSCRFCDKIAVLDGGEIVQYGSHNDLIKEGGLYSRMWNMQAQYYVG
ncbi:MAG: ABC transporter ATP-binding protein [Clostridia bacterium]|nr:ABC transporter ATP-binding protein [Clostridia bacterium]